MKRSRCWSNGQAVAGRALSRCQRGGALVEYVAVVFLLLLVLLASPDDIFHVLAEALSKAYTSFVYALSVSWV